MSQKLENAKNLYLKGIRDGEIQVVHEYSGKRYTQHSTGVADNAEGFIDFFKGFLNRTKKRDIRIIRAIEDGSYVFLHVFQDIDSGKAKWITADMFDTDDDHKLIEHWDVISAYQDQQESASGNDVIFGSFDIKDIDKTEVNKALIRSFIVDVFQNKNYDALGTYISKDHYVQHNANIPDGFLGLQEYLTSHKVNYDFVFHVMGQGNYVVSYSKVTLGDVPFAVFDIYRIEEGKIIEPWDNMEVIPTRSEWANTGKF